MKTKTTLNVSELENPGSFEKIYIREFQQNFDNLTGPNFISAGKNIDYMGVHGH
jgi:hypothetical protein